MHFTLAVVLLFAALTFAADTRPRLLVDAAVIKARCGDNDACQLRAFRQARRERRSALRPRASVINAARVCPIYDSFGNTLSSSTSGKGMIECSYQSGFCTYSQQNGAIQTDADETGCINVAPKAYNPNVPLAYTCPKKDLIANKLGSETTNVAASDSLFRCYYTLDASQPMLFYCDYYKSTGALALDSDGGSCKANARKLK